MLRIAFSLVKPGMVIAQDVFNLSGGLLLAQGSTLTQNHLRKLTQLGIDSIRVDNLNYELQLAPETFREETKMKIIHQTQQAFETYRWTMDINLGVFRDIAKQIINHAIRNKKLLLQMSEVRFHDEYTFSHQVHVCLLSVMTGIKLGYAKPQLVDLGMGALLHDLGKMFIPPEILNKNTPFKPNEWELMKQHVDIGYELFANANTLDDVPLCTTRIIQEHHEKYDGSGYNRRLGGDEIHEYAKIAALADCYDALIADRPYRPAMLPHEAYEIIQASMGTHFDPRVASFFLQNIAPYPTGTVVALNTGDIGMITKITPNLQTRPCIKLLMDAKGKRYNQEKDLDLTRSLTTFIAKVLGDEEVALLSINEGS